MRITQEPEVRKQEILDTDYKRTRSTQARDLGYCSQIVRGKWI